MLRATIQELYSDRTGRSLLADNSASPLVAIIDDIEINRMLLGRLTRSVTGSVRLKTFATPNKALAYFAREQPDLIVSDFSMPGMDAPEFLSRLRRLPGLDETPVIVVSSYSNTDNRRKALLNGATDFLTTPFDHFEFQVRVRNLLRLGLHQKLLRTHSDSLKTRLVSTRLRSLKSVQKTRRHFVSIADSVPAMVFAIDTAGKCVFANQYCFEFFGCSKEDEGSTAQSLALIAKELSDAQFLEHEHDSYYTEVQLRDGGGKDHAFFIVARPVKGAEDEEGIVVFSGIEISELKQVETSLRIAKTEAESADRAKSAFLANMSHEIRTPLNAIIGFSEVIHTEAFGPLGNGRYREYISDILNSARHLLFIIDEILDFSQVESGKQTALFSEFSVLDCIMSVRRMLDQQLNRQKNRVIVESEADFIVKSDRQKLCQVLINIINNANKFMQNGLIRISCNQSAAHEIVISVADSGVGMTEDEVAVAISNFGRVANPAVAHDSNGVGLGLPISIGFMKLLGGRLEIRSEKGRGTTIDLVLPKRALVEKKQPETSMTRLRDLPL